MLNQTKTELRRLFIKQRRSLSEKDCKEKSDRICQNFASLLGSLQLALRNRVFQLT